VNEFLFVGGKEGFGDRIVVAGGASSHRAAYAIDGAEVSEFFGGILAAAVAMENYPSRGLTGD
jgi:hypothetical protein